MLGVGQGGRSVVFSGLFRSSLRASSHIASSPKALECCALRSLPFPPLLCTGAFQALGARRFHNLSFSFDPPKTDLRAKLALHLPKSLIGGRYSSLYVDPEDLLKEPSLLEKFLPRLECFTFNLNQTSPSFQERFLEELEKLTVKEPRFEGLIAPFASKFLCQRAAFSPFFWNLVAKHNRVETAQEMLSILQTQGGEPLFMSENSILSSFLLENLGTWKIDSDKFLLQLFKLAATRKEKKLTSLLWTQVQKSWETIVSKVEFSLFSQNTLLDELLKQDWNILKEAPIEWIFHVGEKGGLHTRIQLLKFLMMKNESYHLEDFFSHLSPLKEADLSKREALLIAQIARRFEGEKGNMEIKNLVERLFQSSKALLMVRHKELSLFLGSYLLYGKDQRGWENFISTMLTIQKENPQEPFLEGMQTLVKLNQQNPFPSGAAALLVENFSSYLEVGDLFSLSRSDTTVLDTIFFREKDPFSLVRPYWDREILDAFFERCTKKNQQELWKNLHLTPTNIGGCLRYLRENSTDEVQKIFVSKCENLSDKDQIDVYYSLFPQLGKTAFYGLKEPVGDPLNSLQNELQSLLFSTFLHVGTKLSGNVASHLFRCALLVENGVEKFSEVFQNPKDYTHEADWSSHEVDVFLELLYRKKKLLNLLEEPIFPPLFKTILAKVLASPYIEEFLTRGKSCELVLSLARFQPQQLQGFLGKFETFLFKEGQSGEEASKLFSKLKDLLRFKKRGNFPAIANLWADALERAMVRGKGALVGGMKSEFHKMGKFFLFFPMLYIQKWDGYQNTPVAENLRELLKHYGEVLKSGDTHVMDNLLSFLEILDSAPIYPLAKMDILKSVMQFSKEETGEYPIKQKLANQIIYRMSVLQIALKMNLSVVKGDSFSEPLFLEKALPFLQAMSNDYKQQFIKKILNERLREAWFRYYSGALEKGLMSEFLELTNRIVLSDHTSRYATRPFEGMWNPTTGQVWEKWKNNREFSPIEGGLRVLFTDDPTDLFLCGEEVSGSCMHTSNKNPFLLHYTNEGVNKMLAVKNTQGSIEARAIVRLIWNDSHSRPALFLETPYGKSAHFQSIQIAAKSLANDTNLELFGFDFYKREQSRETSMIAFEKPSLNGWSDLIGRFDGRTTVSARIIEKASTEDQEATHGLISQYFSKNKGDYDWFTFALALLGAGTILKKSAYYSTMYDGEKK
jgi:hypothetical protein